MPVAEERILLGSKSSNNEKRHLFRVEKTKFKLGDDDRAMTKIHWEGDWEKRDPKSQKFVKQKTKKFSDEVEAKIWLATG